jgi:hypothetical protein
VDLAHHKNRVRRKNSDFFLQGEESLAAFLLRPLGAMKHKALSTVIGQTVGAATGAAFGASAGSTVDYTLESALEKAFDADDESSKAQPRPTAALFPRGDILFVITDRRYLIFCLKQGFVRNPYSFKAAFPLSAITDIQLTLGLVTNKVRLTFSDSTFVLRDLPFGQGKHKKLIKAFTRVRGEAFPPQPLPVQQVAEEQGNQAISPKSSASAVNIRTEPPPLPSPLRSIAYAIARVLVPAGGAFAAILLLVLILVH